MDTKDMTIQIVAARKQIYMLLSSMFLVPPPISFLKSIVHELGNEPTGDFQSLDRAIGEFVQACNNSDEEALKREYNNLFVVTVGSYVTPYESVFLDERTIGNKKVTGLLMGPSAIDVKKWYRQAGMELSDDMKELPDHIGIEIRFMAHLCEMEQEAEMSENQELVAKIKDTQLGFLETHLSKWIEPFVEKVKSNTQSKFYITLCDIAQMLIQEDLASLQKESNAIH